MKMHVEEEMRDSGVRGPGKFVFIQGPMDDVANQSVTQKGVRRWKWHDMMRREREAVTRDNSMSVFAEGFLLRQRRDLAGNDSQVLHSSPLKIS